MDLRGSLASCLNQLEVPAGDDGHLVHVLTGHNPLWPLEALHGLLKCFPYESAILPPCPPISVHFPSPKQTPLVKLGGGGLNETERVFQAGQEGSTRKLCPNLLAFKEALQKLHSPRLAP